MITISTTQALYNTLASLLTTATATAPGTNYRQLTPAGKAAITALYGGAGPAATQAINDVNAGLQGHDTANGVNSFIP